MHARARLCVHGRACVWCVRVYVHACARVWYSPVHQEGVVSLQVALEDAEFPEELRNYELHNEGSVP
jgi:hypothetical protein